MFLHHLTAVLEDWDPAIIDGLAASRPVLLRRMILAGTPAKGGEGIAGMFDVLKTPSLTQGYKIQVDQVMAGHDDEAKIDLSRLADTDLVHGGLNIVEDAAIRHASQHLDASARASNSISWVWSG